MPTILSELAADDRISDRALTVLSGWRDEIRAADLADLRPPRARPGDADDTELGAHRLTLRDKARLLASVCLAYCPIEDLPSLLAGLVDHPEADSMVWWQVTVGSDCIFKGTDDVVRKTFPHLDRRELPVRRLRLAARALLEGDRRTDTELAADEGCGQIDYRLVARIRRTIDTSAADLQAHAAAAYEWVEDETPGGYRAFARYRGIGDKLARHLLADARDGLADL